jgi:DNA-binding transcriptional regulator YiaG
MQKQKNVAGWMDENGLTIASLAFAVHYSPGAVAKWRQEISHPTERAEKAILRAQKRRGWTPFPARMVAA